MPIIFKIIFILIKIDNFFPKIYMYYLYIEILFQISTPIIKHTQIKA
jgi:hypothetical protein